MLETDFALCKKNHNLFCNYTFGVGLSVCVIVIAIIIITTLFSILCAQ